MRTLKNIGRIGLVLTVILLTACGRVSQSNYDKIQTGMSMKQVVSILGKPTNVESIDILGLSGSSATWRSKDGVIAIQFLNNAVQVKSFNKADEQTQEFNLQINSTN